MTGKSFLCIGDNPPNQVEANKDEKESDYDSENEEDGFARYDYIFDYNFWSQNDQKDMDENEDKIEHRDNRISFDILAYFLICTLGGIIVYFNYPKKNKKDACDEDDPCDEDEDGETEIDFPQRLRKLKSEEDFHEAVEHIDKRDHRPESQEDPVNKTI